MLIPLVASSVVAVSPMPEEIEKDAGRKAIEKVKAGENNTVCSIKIIYTKNIDPAKEDYSAAIVLEGFLKKKDALEKTITFYEDKLKKEDISEVFIECKFHN